MLDRPTLITCAITGNITKPEQTPYLPVTPEQIANECLASAEAGAAAVHIHVRDPATGRPSMELEHYRDVVERIRKRNKSLIINLTTGPGGRFVPDANDPKIYAPGTTLVPPEKRVEHIAIIKPDICSLDLNTMNSGADVVINTPRNVRIMAKVIRDAGVKPELEIFDSGDLHLARDLINDGTLDGPGMRTEFPIVAQSWLYGGHVRVGMEDNIYLEKGVLAQSNAQLVAKAADIIKQMGGQVANTTQARDMLHLNHA